MESRLSGKATERQVMGELGLEGSHRVDRRQEMVHRQHFNQQNYQRQKHQSVKNVWYDQGMGWGQAVIAEDKDGRVPAIL